MMKKANLTSIEICAGAGGQALGLEQAGFDHLALVELELPACATLKHNRPKWNVINQDVRDFKANAYLGKVDLLSGGVPCPPFSIAGKQLGAGDERDLFPEALRIVSECMPQAIMLENVKGLLGPKFKGYRSRILERLNYLGYKGEWRLITSSEHGVSQLRPRAILVAMRDQLFDKFKWPEPNVSSPKTIGKLLYQEMAANGWRGAKEWKSKANGIGPTLVGGSKKHGGADLGPTRAREGWAKLGVEGRSLANESPDKEFVGMPRLTLKMTALVQGFPESWEIIGKKTAGYRQVGNAFPPPVAKCLGLAIANAITSEEYYGKETRSEIQTEIIFH